MTPASIVLLPHGETVTTFLPSTAQEVCSEWRHDFYFPEGVVLHKMMHLNTDLVARLEVSQHLSPSRVETVSVSLLLDRRSKHAQLEPNYHEIPRFLDTQLFYGNVLVILTIDGCTVIPLCRAQYDLILQANTFKCRSPDQMSISSEGPPVIDEDSADMSLESMSDDEGVEFLNFSFQPFSVRRPVRPVF